jgi:hypothetical protein
MLSAEYEQKMEQQFPGLGDELIFQLARELAGVHVGDGDELGWIAVKLLTILNRKDNG